jgi:glycosyltransferase involved in cell wall biosynthesis
MGDFGLYFKNGDAQELAKKLEEATMIDWAAKSQQAYEIAKRFDVTTIVKQWKSLLDK